MIGKTISHFKIIEKLGEGGMGIVYKAEDTKLKRTVAIKFLPVELTRDEQAKNRFIQEAQAASALEHNNICNIHEIDETVDGQSFIVMAYYEGETLRKKLEKGKLSVNESVDIAIQIAQGLAEAHENDKIHRDIKPANILITKKGDVKILDFGIAKLSGQTLHTKTGSTLGTVAYMSPEQTQGAEVDHRTDIWSLGVILYEMLSGEKPFKGEIDQAVMYGIVNNEEQPLQEICPDISPELLHVVNRAMEKDPENRYQSVNETLIDLKRIRVNGTKNIQGFKSKNKKRFYLPVVISFTILIILIFVVAYYLVFTKTSEPLKAIPIVVIDAQNETDEIVLNGISDMLIIDLEQSRQFSILTRSYMFDLLKKMKVENVDRIDESLGRKICQFANVNLIAIPTIRKFDNLYSLALRVEDLKQNKHLFTDRAEGEGLGSIPNIIDNIAANTRKGLKESDQEIQQRDQKVADVTSINLDAHYHFWKSEELISFGHREQARLELEQAIKLDPNFGRAYLRLAAISADVKKREHIQKAFEFINAIPEREKYLLQIVKARQDGSIDKAFNILLEMQQLYPNDKDMWVELGVTVQDDSLKEKYFNKAISIDPTYYPAVSNLITLYRRLNQYEKALPIAQNYISVDPIQGNLLTANLLQAMEKYDSSIEYYKKLIAIDSTQWETYYFLMLIYRRTHQYEKMVQAAKKLIYTYTRTDDEHFLEDAATSFAMADKIEEGINIFARAGRLFPERNMPLTNGIAALLTFKEDFKQSEYELRELINNSEDKQILRIAYDKLARALVYQGRYREAISCNEKNIELGEQINFDMLETKYKIRNDLFRIIGWNKINNNWKEVDNLNFYDESRSFLYLIFIHSGQYQLAYNLNPNWCNSAVILSVKKQSQ
jgi:serine/threonine protein kinase/tetratricopeptide (TPR) repeat protein